MGSRRAVAEELVRACREVGEYANRVDDPTVYVRIGMMLGALTKMANSAPDLRLLCEIVEHWLPRAAQKGDWPTDRMLGCEEGQQAVVEFCQHVLRRVRARTSWSAPLDPALAALRTWLDTQPGEGTIQLDQEWPTGEE